jgi:hypothetical protein
VNEGHARTHLTPEQVAGWWARTLSSEATLAALAHVETCDRCRDALAARHPAQVVARKLAEELLEPRGAAHPDRGELAGWIDGTLSELDGEAVASHLVACDLCRSEASDLASFASTLAPEPGAPLSDPGIAPQTAPRWGRRALAWGTLAAGLTALVLIGRSTLDESRRGPGAGRPPGSSPSGSPSEGPEQAPLELRDGPLVITAVGEVSGVDAPWQELVRRAVEGPALTPPAVAGGLLRAGERQRTAGTPSPAVSPLEPLSRVVLDRRPRFVWSGPRALEPYRVEIYDASFRRVAASPPLVERAWTPGRPLPAGEELTWQVVSLRGDETVAYPRPPEPPAVVLIAEPAVAREVAAARASGSRLVAGLALWRAGLLEEAAAELAALARDNPESEVARRLAESAARRPPAPRAEPEPPGADH